MAGKRQRFGRVKVRIDELQQPGIIDFAKLLKESAPADEPDAARAPFQTKEVGMGLVVDDSVPGEDMSDDEDNRGVGKKGRGGRGIYEDIIAKWSSLSAPDAGNGSDEEGDGSGGGLSDGDDAPDSDDYEYDDGLIDNSELKQKFTSRAIAKQKRKRQRNVGDSGFRIDNDEEDEEELVGEEDEDDDEDEVGDEEEGESGGDSMARTQDGKMGSRPGGVRPQGQKRRRRRQWLRDGEKDFKEVQQVKDAIRDKLGIDGQKLVDGSVKENSQDVVEVFQVAEEHNCAVDKLLEWISIKLDKSMQSVEKKIRKAFTDTKKGMLQQQVLEKLDGMMRHTAPSRGALEVGSIHDEASFAAMVDQLLRAEMMGQAPTPQQLKTGLRNLFKEVLRKVRICRDGGARQPLEEHVYQQVLQWGQNNLVDQLQRQDLKEKLDQTRKNKLTPAVPGGGCSGTGAFALASAPADGLRPPFKHNVFDAIPPSELPVPA